MSNPITLARPYAKAAFLKACEQNKIQSWFEVLKKLACIIVDKQLSPLVKNPLISKKSKTEIIFDVLGKEKEEDIKSFLEILAEKERLILLPDIFTLFYNYKNNYENTKEVVLITAYPLIGEDKTRLITALEKRFKAKVHLKIQEDRSIIGGAIIQSDDIVIDGSIKGKLQQMKEQLLA